MTVPVHLNPTFWDQRDQFSGTVSSGGHGSVGGSATAGLAEQLLTIPHRIAFSPSRMEFLEAAAGELRKLLGAEARVHWLMDATEPDVDTSAEQIKLQITEQRQPLATLELSRIGEFSAEEQRLLAHLAQSLSYLLSVNAMAVETRLLADLSSTLPTSYTLESAAQDAVDALLRHLEAQSVTLLKSTFSGFRTLAGAGEWPTDIDAMAIAEGSMKLGEPVMRADGLLTCPVAGDGKARFILLLKFPGSEPGVSAKASAVQQAARALAPHLEARWRTFVLGELLKLNEETADTPTEVMYDRILQTAVRLVPGADSGSLSTRASGQEPFAYQAVQGFDADKLLGKLTTEEEAKAWYGADNEGWLHGIPREIRSDETDIAAYGLATTPKLDVVVASYADIRTSLCLPVLHDGDVLALLNLENQSDPAAFGREALEVFRLFGAPLASLLHRQRLRDVLMHAALNDELTGLANRRAYADACNRALARHKRDGRPVSILVMDLKGFKQVNDTLGHDAGDDALQLVARTLQENARDGDLVCRLGGDEFAILMSDTPANEAALAALRLRNSISRIEFRGMQIQMNIGSATAPDDGSSLPELSVLADRRMYQDKRGNSR